MEVVVGDEARAKVVSRILATGVIAVIRLNSSRRLGEVAPSLTRGGVDVLELTMTTPGALESISAARADLGAAALIGAGTVLTTRQARDALAAGAQYLVAPTIDPEVLRLAHDAEVPCILGALTPNEIFRAWTLGADLIKVFPGRVATPGYFRDLLGPLPDVRLLPTGNVSLETAPEYIKAGAVALGVGKALVDAEAVESGSWEAITARAREFSEVVRRAREAGR